MRSLETVRVGRIIALGSKLPKDDETIEIRRVGWVGEGEHEEVINVEGRESNLLGNYAFLLNITNLNFPQVRNRR